jgi:hypothetical protein
MQTPPKLSVSLMLILCKICTTTDKDALKAHVFYCSNHLSDSDYTRIVYSTMKLLYGQKCKAEPCEDWLVSNLYAIYRSG